MTASYGDGKFVGAGEGQRLRENQSGSSKRMADYPRFTDLQVFLPRIEAITLRDVPGEEHQTEVMIHDEFGATVSIRLTSYRRIRVIDLRRR